MSSIQSRKDAFVALGRFLGQFSPTKIEKKDGIPHNELFFDALKHQIKIAQESNGWFTQENVLHALASWGDALQTSSVDTWLQDAPKAKITDKVVAIIMAGNIPLVGFHDFLSVLISGHKVLVKQSSNDTLFLPLLAKYLEYVEPSFKGAISFTENKLEGFDAIIATGSDNTARYFEYYFKDKPHIIRKNRNSVAVIQGNESLQDFELLSEDIFRYYGLGCRSVSKLFVPKGYSFDHFFEGMYHRHEIINNVKYANNYDYNKAVYLMSEFDMLENGFMMIKEDASYASPIATIFYEYYDDLVDLKIKLHEDKDKIQCIVARDFMPNEIAFGQTQSPKLWDYADNVNTLEFLAEI